MFYWFFYFQVVFQPVPTKPTWWYVIQVTPRSKQVYEDYELVDNDLTPNGNVDIASTSSYDNENVPITEEFVNIEEINEPFQQAAEEVTTDPDDENEVQVHNILETYLQMGETIADYGEDNIHCNLILDIFEEEDLQEDDNYNENEENN